MDELGGWLLGIVMALIAVYMAIKFAFLAFGYAFVAFSGFAGHPLFAVLLLGGLGAGAGLVQLRRRAGETVARSSDDFATIGSLKMTPESWSVAVVVLFIVIVGLYGRFVV